VEFDLKSALLGVGLLLFAKYVVIGLDAWNGVFHSEPAEFIAFRKPMLTGVADCPKCRAFWGQF
jgi:hypothetical protein